MKPLIDGEGKVCRVCKTYKTHANFPPNKECAFGVTGTCRECYNSKVKTWYSQNRKRRQEEANKRNRERKQKVVEYFGSICFRCKQSFPQYVFEFHHLDPKKKDVNPSVALARSEKRMWEELNKCIMLCSNCHKIEHWGEREEWDEATN